MGDIGRQQQTVAIYKIATRQHGSAMAVTHAPLVGKQRRIGCATHQHHKHQSECRHHQEDAETRIILCAIMAAGAPVSVLDIPDQRPHTVADLGHQAIQSRCLDAGCRTAPVHIAMIVNAHG